MNRIAVVGVLLLASCTSVQTRIEIEAPANDVRAVLLNFDDYPEWNPFIVEAEGFVLMNEALKRQAEKTGH